MRLVVANYVSDEARSLDCILCDEDEAGQQFTSLVFADEDRGTSFCVCPEHLEEMVTAALERHKDGLKANNHFWYLDADKDPWDKP